MKEKVPITCKNSILICTPYLDKIGGTEIEAINTSIFLYDKNNKVSIFCPNRINLKPFYKILNNRKIDVFTYPIFLSNNFFKLVNRFFFKLGFKVNICDYIYWKYKSAFFSKFFILTYPRCTYFFPLSLAVPNSKKRIAKVTMNQFEVLDNNYYKFYKKFHKIILFNKAQTDYWAKKYKFKQCLDLDIMIPNEENLLMLNPQKKEDEYHIVFGFLGRISREKNISDMIKLIHVLNIERGYESKLIIQGIGNDKYINELKELVILLKVINYVEFLEYEIDPMSTHNFYGMIDVFLVTSQHEGGPMTSLEAAAAGKIIISYDVGAMVDRFSKFNYIINKDFSELCSSAISIINLDLNERIELSFQIRKYYLLKLSNKKKGEKLFKLLQ